MPTIAISNTTKNTISIGSVIGALKPGQSKVLELTSDELEKTRERLVRLESLGSISVEVLSNSDSQTAPAARTYGDVHLYVDASTGSDENSGSKDAPLASLVEVEKRVPFYVDHPVFIHVRPHPGSGYDPPTFRGRICHANIYVIGEGYNVLASGTITSNHNLFLTVDIAPGADDALRGKTLEILDGPLATERRILRTNVGTAITPQVAFSTLVPPGSKYRITESTVIINAPTGPAADPTPSHWTISEGCGYAGSGYINSGFRQSTHGLVLVNLKLRATDNMRASFAGNLIMFGIEIIGTATIAAFAGSQGTSHLQIGCDTTLHIDGIAARAALDLGAKTGIAWAAWGMYCTLYQLHFNSLQGLNMHGLDAELVVFWGCHRAYLTAFRITSGMKIYGEIQNGSCNVYVDRHTQFLGDANTSNIEGSLDPVVYVYGTLATLHINCSIVSLANTTALYVRRGAKVVITSGGGLLTLDSGTGTAVKVTQGARVWIAEVPGYQVTTVGAVQWQIGTKTPLIATDDDFVEDGDHVTHSDGSQVMWVI